MIHILDTNRSTNPNTQSYSQANMAQTGLALLVLLSVSGPVAATADTHTSRRHTQTG